MQTKNTPPPPPMIKSTLNSELVAKSIGYHGQPLQKVWEGEHGDHNLFSLGITMPDYSMYQKRQKHFAFQDRTKRLKMHLFIAKKAKELFTKDSVNSELARSNRINEFDGSNHAVNDLYAEMPPMSLFLPEKVCKIELVQHLYSQLSVGDIVYCTVSSHRNIAGVIVRVLATHPPNVRIFHDLNAKAFLPGSVQKPIIDHAGNTRLPQCNDILCCEIIELYESGDRMVVGMKGQFYQQKSANENVTLGLISADQLPNIYKLSVASVGKSYETVLEESAGFNNPRCIEHLSQSLGLDSSVFYTNMSGLRGKYPNEEYASDLRQSQASSWAFRSVAEGIEHFKEGRHSEAFQCLNKALTIDPRNVEGLVARGALYANNGSFKKAVDDFETALKISPSHANARKYMGETLVALGRSYEEDNRLDEAKKAYQDCLAIIPHHEEAQSSLNFLWSKSNAPNKLIELNDLALPALNLKINEQNRGEGSVGGSVSISDVRKESSSKKSKKKKSKNRKRHSSSSSSSDSSDSSDSSSANSSSSSESSSSSDSDSKSKKKKKRSEKSRQKSLSPLSKRMTLLGGVGDSSGMDAATNAAYNYAQSYGTTAVEAPNEYDLRVSKFLDMTRDEDNYEEKVRKLVEEASKYTKDRKMQEEKSKKKDRKKSKRNKKDSKKKKKEKKSKSSKKDKDDLIDGIELREALKIFTKLPLFEMNAKKLSEIENVEKTLNQLKEEEKKLSAVTSVKPETSESKWKMAFAKDSKKEMPIPKQYAFPMDDEADSDGGRDGRSHRKSPDRKNTASSHASTSSRSRYDTTKHSPVLQLPPVAMSSVLDKFGSFRRATNVPDKPPEPPAYRRSRSKSRSRSASRSHSRRRSRSRSSRSRSYGGRRSRSYSQRSYSRSRSRSGSFGGSNYRRRWRGSNYRPRGNNFRVGQFNRSNNNFRDFKNRGRDRWNRGNGWGNRGGRYRNFRDDSRERRFDRRSTSYSPERRRSNDRRSPPPPPSNAQPQSPPKQNPFSAPGGEQSVEEIERMLEKAKKDKQEEMIERNRDLVKTNQ